MENIVYDKTEQLSIIVQMLIIFRSSRKNKQIDWRQRCREILEIIWDSNDSVPFREPVDTLEHPGKFCECHINITPFSVAGRQLRLRQQAKQNRRIERSGSNFCFSHSDYLQIIDTPMDLRTIKEDLIGGNYESANAFIKDVRRIFSNSRSYNTNRQSRVSLR